jgi:guanylate kinase
MGKLIIFSAPSGSGKSTLINYLVSKGFDFSFSISATSRAPRGTEKNGVEYYFLSVNDFKKHIENNDFIEYEEVYPNCFYGTLKSEVDKALETEKTLLFDVDVKGGVNIKNMYKEKALAIFIQPPSVDVLRQRLIDRDTDSEEMIEKRVAKAAWEMNFAPQFDVVIVNDSLEKAKEEVETAIRNFLKQ